jgi:hypothetical protein
VLKALREGEAVEYTHLLKDESDMVMRTGRKRRKRKWRSRGRTKRLRGTGTVTGTGTDEGTPTGT